MRNSGPAAPRFPGNFREIAIAAPRRRYSGPATTKVSMFNTRFSEWDEPSEPIYCKIEFADSKIGRDRPCELLSAHSHFRWSIFDNSCFFSHILINFTPILLICILEKLCFGEGIVLVFTLFFWKQFSKTKTVFIS